MRHEIAVSCHETNYPSISIDFCNLTKHTFLPERGENISGRKWRIFRTQTKISAFIGYRLEVIIVPKSILTVLCIAGRSTLRGKRHLAMTQHRKNSHRLIYHFYPLDLLWHPIQYRMLIPYSITLLNETALFQQNALIPFLKNSS